jgi:hypothetical protein
MAISPRFAAITFRKGMGMVCFSGRARAVAPWWRAALSQRLLLALGPEKQGGDTCDLDRVERHGLGSVQRGAS